MVPVVIVTGGVLLALLHRWAADEGIVEQVSDAADPVGLHRRRTAFLALRGVVAVAFGGAIGPEASLIAVMGEISALVTTRVARDREEERLIGETGISASLGALYGAPTGSTLFEPDSTERAVNLANIIAGAVGFVSFLLVHDLFSAPSSTLGLHHVDLSAWDVAFSAVAALAGAALALGYVGIRGPVGALARRITRPGSASSRALRCSRCWRRRSPRSASRVTRMWAAWWTSLHRGRGGRCWASRCSRCWPLPST